MVATLCWCLPAFGATEIGNDEYIIFYHNDALGSPLVVTDHNGNTLWHEHSNPYGRSRDRVMPTGQEFFNDHSGSRKGYTGHLKDTGADLVYMKARFYDPVVGRFYSNDPIGFNTDNPMMFNRYAYANNNPYRYIDPDGRDAQDGILQGFRELWEGFSGQGDGEFNFDRISEEYSRDNDLGFGQANSEWRTGRTEAYSQDASKLTLIRIRNDGLHEGRRTILAFPVNILDMLVHGRVRVAFNADGSAEIISETYNFEPREDASAGRNIGTAIGWTVADPIGSITGTGRNRNTGFTVEYDGQPNILIGK